MVVLMMTMIIVMMTMIIVMMTMIIVMMMAMTVDNILSGWTLNLVFEHSHHVGRSNIHSGCQYPIEL